MSENPPTQESLFDVAGPRIPVLLPSLNWVHRGQYDILSRVATAEWERLIEFVAQGFKDLSEDCCQSGDDSQYLTVWEEYCAQVQGQESVMFELYESTVEQLCEAAIHPLQDVAQAILWVFGGGYTNYQDWVDEHNPSMPCRDQVESDLLKELQERVRVSAVDEELMTLDQRLLSIAPYYKTSIGLMGDPGYFMGNMFADAAEYVLSDPSSFGEVARQIAPDVLEDMEGDGVSTYEFGATPEERQTYIACELEEFFYAWRAQAKREFGERLGL